MNETENLINPIEQYTQDKSYTKKFGLKNKSKRGDINTMLTVRSDLPAEKKLSNFSFNKEKPIEISPKTRVLTSKIEW